MPFKDPKILRLAVPLAVVCIGAVYWVSRDAAPDRAAKPAMTAAVPDPLPHRPVCDFWQPWNALVAPQTTDVYLKRIRRRLEDQSQHSEKYRAAIRAASGVLEGGNEQVCILGRVRPDESFSLDVASTDDCAEPPSAFFDTNLALTAETVDGGGYINNLEFKLGLEAMSPGRLHQFLRGQMKLLGGGYQGWSKAFPHYYDLNHRGLALTGAKGDPDGRTKVTYSWLNQAMLATFNTWSRYLLGLGDMVTIETTFDDGTAVNGGVEPFLRSELDTGLSGLSLLIGPRAHGYLASPEVSPLVVSHDIIVRFAGLHIKLIGMKFGGTLSVSDEEVSYIGAFTGVDDVDIGGSYRGLGTEGLGGMIVDMVRDAVNAEVDRLKSGNHGQGWPFKIVLKESAAGGAYLLYATSFQSPVNFISLLKAEKTQKNGFVLPSDDAVGSLNLWARQSFEALIKDQARSSCQ